MVPRGDALSWEAMSRPLPRPSRTALLLGVAFLLLLVGGIGLAWMLARQGVRSPLRVVLVTTSAAATVPTLETGQGRAIGALVQEHLEYYGGFAVTSVTEVPADLELLRGQRHTLLLQLEPRRQGQNLELSYRYVWGRQLEKGKAPGWVVHPATARIEHLPLPPGRDLQLRFLPDRLEVVAGEVDRGAPRQWSIPWMGLLPRLAALGPHADRAKPGTALVPFPKD